MAILELNHNKIPFHSNEYLNIKSLVPKIQKQFPLERFSLANFKINGEEINLNSEDPAMIRPISDTDLIQVDYIAKYNAQMELITDLSDLIDRIIQSVHICCDTLKDDDCIPTERFSKVIEAVDMFIQSMGHTLKILPDCKDLNDSLPIKELQIHLLSVIKAIITAHTKSDTIMLTDLLEFELKDNLTQWKILIIPNLKQSLRNI